MIGIDDNWLKAFVHWGFGCTVLLIIIGVWFTAQGSRLMGGSVLGAALGVFVPLILLAWKVSTK